ncbi:hypothetical protein [Aquisalimonas sp.]
MACLGILDAGAVLTPLDTQMPASATHVIEGSGIRHVFIGTASTPRT